MTYRGLIGNKLCLEFGTTNVFSAQWIEVLFTNYASKLPDTDMRRFVYHMEGREAYFYQLRLPRDFGFLVTTTYGEQHVGRLWAKRIPEWVFDLTRKRGKLIVRYLIRSLEAEGGIEVSNSVKIRFLVTCDEGLLKDFTKLLREHSINYYIKVDRSKVSRGWKTYYSVYLAGTSFERREIIRDLVAYSVHPMKRRLLELVLRYYEGELDLDSLRRRIRELR
ncbi:MAG: hypothetical protein DRJ40_00005, partial [Thermoprotei archaeon]